MTWLHIDRGTAPLIVSIPHAGLTIPDDIADALVDPDFARHDADLYVDRLYAFARDLGATIIRSDMSRTVIDLNRDPSGVSLYPGQVTTGLCPTESFDGDPLYKAGSEPDEAEIARRRALYFDPYHAALEAELFQLREGHGRVVLYDAHSIRSLVPRLFDGALPQFNIGSDGGRTCAPELTAAVEIACLSYSGESRNPSTSSADGPRLSPGHDGDGAQIEGSVVVNGRFRGGWITRHYAAPERGIHTIQMELSMRGYLDEMADWPAPWDADYAAPMQAVLRNVLNACIEFASSPSPLQGRGSG